ncbi:MAG: hypothetical protein MUF46_07550 [Desulfobacterales bacterium]|nr:hypothetical protein [Desulfobacterales bacterium]
MTLPVRPTWQRISSTTVTARSGGNFHATAQRGERLTKPSRPCQSSRSTLSTTPSMLKPRFERFSSSSSKKARSSAGSASRTAITRAGSPAGNPQSAIRSSASDWVRANGAELSPQPWAINRSGRAAVTAGLS